MLTETMCVIFSFIIIHQITSTYSYINVDTRKCLSQLDTYIVCVYIGGLSQTKSSFIHNSKSVPLSMPICKSKQQSFMLLNKNVSSYVASGYIYTNHVSTKFYM